MKPHSAFYILISEDYINFSTFHYFSITFPSDWLVGDVDKTLEEQKIWSYRKHDPADIPGTGFLTSCLDRWPWGSQSVSLWSNSLPTLPSQEPLYTPLWDALIGVHGFAMSIILNKVLPPHLFPFSCNSTHKFLLFVFFKVKRTQLGTAKYISLIPHASKQTMFTFY